MALVGMQKSNMPAKIGVPEPDCEGAGIAKPLPALHSICPYFAGVFGHA